MIRPLIIAVVLSPLALGCTSTHLSRTPECQNRPVITPTAGEIALLSIETKRQILKVNDIAEKECGVKPGAP